MGVENIKLGTCKIKLDATDLGLTIGGVEVEVSTDTHQTKVDQHGETIVKEFIKGRNMTVRLSLAETTLENMVSVMPGATLITDGGDPTKKKVEVTSGTGIDLLTSAGKLTLHPVELPDSDKSEDLTLPKASTPGGLSFSYKSDEERVFTTEFSAYPDDTGVLFTYGDETATA